MNKTSREQKPIIFQSDRPGERLVLTSEVLRFLFSHQQRGPQDAEAGGMLFAKIEKDLVVVDEATGPTASDRRGRFFFWPNVRKQHKTIGKLFERSRHYVGEWHTHPERFPAPSRTDISSMEELFAKAKHQLEGMIMVIVGTQPAPDGLWVGVHRRGEFMRLSLIA